MTSEQFREAIARLGLTRLSAAAAMDVDERTIRRWAKGETPIPKAVELALKGLEAQTNGWIICQAPNSRQ